MIFNKDGIKSIEIYDPDELTDIETVSGNMVKKDEHEKIKRERNNLQTKVRGLLFQKNKMENKTINNHLRKSRNYKTI